MLKFILCGALGILFAAFIGDPYCFTMSVTSSLVLYRDRGWMGSLVYGWKRLEVQIVQGALVLFVIAVIRELSGSAVSDTFTAILATSIAILIGLSIHYRHPIAPLTTTLANATFIMAGGVLGKFIFYPRRLSYCLVGALVAMFAEWLSELKHDRYLESIAMIRYCMAYQLVKLGIPSGESEDISTTNYLVSKEMLLTHLSHLERDFDRIPFKRMRTKDEISGLINLKDAVDILELTVRDLDRVKSKLSKEYLSWYLSEIRRACDAIDCALSSEAYPEPGTVSPYKENGSDHELLLMSDLVRLRALVSVPV